MQVGNRRDAAVHVFCCSSRAEHYLVAHRESINVSHTIIISEFLPVEHIANPSRDDINVVANIATFPRLKRHQRLGVVAPFGEIQPANAAGLILSLGRAPDGAQDFIFGGFFLFRRHTIIILEFLDLRPALELIGCALAILMRAIADGDESPASTPRDLFRLLVHTLIITRFPITGPSSERSLPGQTTSDRLLAR